MLQRFAERFQNLVLVALVLLISAVFILQFGGPQSAGCSTDSTLFAAKVHGTTITQGDLRAAYVLAAETRLYGFQAVDPKGLKQLVLDGLIERSLMAEEARDMGFRVAEDDIMEEVAENCSMLLSTASSASQGFKQNALPFSCKDKDGNFSVENVVNFVQYRLRRSLKEFSEWQIEEKLAKEYADTLTAGITVGEQEVWDAYAREKEKVTLKYLRFSPTYYKNQLKPSEKEITSWQAANKDKVDKRYEEQKQRYTNLEPQVRARHILIKVAEDADQASKEAAFAKAEDLAKKAKTGADFAKLAEEFSDDKGSAVKGGDLGYNPKGRMVQEFDKAQFAMEPGQISEVVESKFGFHIIKVEAKRQGDVPIAEAKAEIAHELYLETESTKLAQTQAQAILDRLKNGENIDVLEKELKEKAEASKTLDPLAPQVRETRAFDRSDTPIPGPFNNQPLVDKAFSMDTNQPLPDKPMKLGNEWLVFRVQAHDHADVAAFDDSEKERLRSALLRNKQKDLLATHIKHLRKQAEDSKDVHINPKVLSDGSDEQSEDEG
ncbi:MAG: peptidylprolyl isomerase [Myxococcales bacterium]|nr:MAG: peptidylprolyl isomerase [Myxococcales bacterium]